MSTPEGSPRSKPRNRRNKSRRFTMADECEAFLAGRSWQLYEDAGYAVPNWAHLNRLAHGSFVDLVDLATPSAVTRPYQAMTWDRALRLLAQQLIADAGNPLRVRAVQASALVPLEPLMFTDGIPLDLLPQDFFQLVLAHIVEAALQDHEQR